MPDDTRPDIPGPLVMPADEFAAVRAVAEACGPVASAGVPGSDDSGRDSPTRYGQARECTGPSSPDAREPLGRLVRETWVRWALEQPDRKPSWTVPWEDLDDGQREVDMRIGEAAAAAERERDAEARTACEAQIDRLERHLDTLAREHARHALAVSAHKARADQQESRAVRAEKQLARFAGHAEEYDGLAAQAAQGQRDADLVAELRRRIVILERQAGQCRAADARLTEIRRTIAAFLGHHGNSAAFALQSARDLAEGIRQVLDRAALDAPETGKEPRP